MYLQYCVKGIGADGEEAFTWSDAQAVIAEHVGIPSNWCRKNDVITPAMVAHVLTDDNLDRHLHDYGAFGDKSPFISLACGAVERDANARQNWVYSAVDTALMFATESWTRPGALFFLWVIVNQRPAVAIPAVAEPVGDLSVYRRWSGVQLEGEVTAKVHIAANQIERVEWWDESFSKCCPKDTLVNSRYVPPEKLSDVRELF